MNENEYYKRTYEYLWGQGVDGYRSKFRNAPALARAFIHKMDIAVGDSCMDWGCGMGLLGLHLFEYGCKVDMVDIAHNSPNSEVLEALVLNDDFNFHVGSVVDFDLGRNVNWSISTDVLEHLTLQDAMSAAENISLHSDKGFCLRIAMTPGAYTGKDGMVIELHRTIRSADWWEPRLLEATYPAKLVERQEYGTAVVFTFKGKHDD